MSCQLHCFPNGFLLLILKYVNFYATQVSYTSFGCLAKLTVNQISKTELGGTKQWNGEIVQAHCKWRVN